MRYLTKQRRTLLILIAITAYILPVRAQDNLRRYIQMNLSGDYKHINYPDGTAASIGYAASIEYIDNHFLIAAGFENGIRNKSMEQYNTLLTAKTGYVFYADKFHLTPFIKAGWFMDVRKTRYSDITAGYHQFLCGAGVEGTWLATPLIWITASAQFIKTSLSGNGFTFCLGIIIPMFEFDRKNKYL